jgi:hypothetical protein
MDTASRKITATLTDPHSGGIASVAFAPNGTTLAIRCAISADSSSWFVDGSQMVGLLAVGWRGWLLSAAGQPR